MYKNKLPDELIRKMESGREYRRMAVPLTIRADGDENGMEVEGYATTFNQVYELFRDGNYIVQEMVDPNAFEKCDMADVIMQYDHMGRVFARNKNNTLDCEPDEHGLHVLARLGGTDLGRQVYQEIRGGYSDKMSFGFTVEESKREVTENIETGKIIVLRTITMFRKLYDVSVVSIPANDTTEIYARSAVGGGTGWAMQELHAYEERRRKQKLLELKLKLMEV